MSREDPQFKLRMPTELRQQAEQAAKAAGRSLNSELVGRLEASYLSENAGEKLIPAARAKELAMTARKGIPAEIKRRAIQAINSAMRLGQNETYADIGDLQLYTGIPDDEAEKLINAALIDLTEAGYEVDCNDVEAIHIKF